MPNDTLKQSYTPGLWAVSRDFLTNDGARPIMAPDAQMGKVRIALVDCRTKYKRGEGWKSSCPIREANARLIAQAPRLVETLKQVLIILQAEGGYDGLCIPITRLLRDCGVEL